MVSEKSWATTFILAVFFGSFGVHRFYVGKWKSGIVMLLTSGLFGIWTIIDIVRIAIGKFTDENGKIVALDS